MRWTIKALIFTVALACLAGVGLIWSSPPIYHGKRYLPSLRAPVTVAFDRFAIPTIEAQSRQDAFRTLGFLHAQERFLQMELGRRKMAGKLAEIIGQVALDSDIRQRVLGFYQTAEHIVANLPLEQRHLCQAYAEGVNAYFKQTFSIEARLLGIEQEPWRCRDTILIILSMFQELDEIGDPELMLTVMSQTLPQEVIAFLTPDQDLLDRPLLGKPCSRRPAQPVPVAAIARLLGQNPAAQTVELSSPWGSNQWAIASPQGALLANDMHLPLAVPNIWYRARLRYEGLTLDGITLPGVPGLIAGSNGHIAWGFTNAMADVRDFVVLETNPAQPGRYRTPEGWEQFQSRIETIIVKGQAAKQVTVHLTRWGPVVVHDWLQRPLAVHWSALDPTAVDFTLLELDRVQTVFEALSVLNRAGMPVQNALVADAHGHIGWTLSGRVPKREGFDGSVSQSWADGKSWLGYYSPEELPRLIDPPGGVIATANHRTLGCDQPLIGHNFALSFRIARIYQYLAANPSADPLLNLALQLDTDANFYRFYQNLALSVLEGDSSPLAERIRSALHNWNGRADEESIGIALLDRWRADLSQKVLGPLFASCLRIDPHFRYQWLKSEVPLRALLRLRHPATLPDRSFSGWSSFLRSSLVETASALEQTYHQPIDKLTWGQVNRTQIRHPLAAGLPWLARWLNLPEAPVAGCPECVRVARPNYGASMRLVAVAGHPSVGFLQMPGGQSGHPLSPHYADQYSYWVEGQALPLAPGHALSVLELLPGRD
ncbi:MAG: penicillin acylase family protein [Methylohalobius sp.]|nr:penicillin acylase family protein [Methylohalobius sp.]